MWAALSLPVAVPVPFPAAIRLSTGVPRKLQLYSQLRNFDATEQKQQIRKKSQTKHRHQSAEEEKQGDSKQKLTGFDVLQALEKARARKMKKRRNGTSSLLNSRKVIGEGRKGTPEDSPLTDYGNNKIVRAFNIKEDWGTRLDELEKRLQQLVDTTPAA